MTYKQQFLYLVSGHMTARDYDKARQRLEDEAEAQALRIELAGELALDRNYTDPDVIRNLPLPPVNYWKVGVTDKPDPLMRDRQRYDEVFRCFSIPPHPALSDGGGKVIRHIVEKPIARTFRELNTCVDWEWTPVGNERLSPVYPLETALHIFDREVESFMQEHFNQTPAEPITWLTEEEMRVEVPTSQNRELAPMWG